MSGRIVTRRLSGMVVAGALALALLPGSPAQAGPGVNPNTDGPRARTVDTSTAIVQLAASPLATAPDVDRLGDHRVDWGGAKSKAYRTQLAAHRGAFKQWMQDSKLHAKVTREFDTALNAVTVKLNGTSLDTLRKAPGVASAQYQTIYTPTAADPDLARINALAGWLASGAATTGNNPRTWAGYGIKVGVVDAGIDITHPCFDDSGFPRVRQLGDTRFTNNKVIVARVFNNDTNPDAYTPEAIGEHGTHVAGTLACDLTTTANVDGAAIPYAPSGVAPGALLGNYNVFPGNVTEARTEDIVAAMEAAAADGMDVLNLSLGGEAQGDSDPLTVAVDNLDRAGIVVAVSAGNSGPSYLTIESPGRAERALTAGAATVGHFVGVPIMTSSSQVAVAAIGEFAVPTSDLTRPLAAVTADDGSLALACAALPADSLTGKIAVVSRGDCMFNDKVVNTEAAGAAAVIIVNNRPGDPIAMARDVAPTTIPAVMVAQDLGEVLAATDGQQVTLGANRVYTYTGNNDILSDFSSRGPVASNFQVKPDVIAPGENVLSSIPVSYCKDQPWVATAGCWAIYSGTSMASPHLAGMAAVVLATHPTWQPWQVRSAIINTADEDGVLQAAGSTTPDTDVLNVGAGMADLKTAVKASVALSSPSLSFGMVSVRKTQTATVTVTNLRNVGVTLSVRIKRPVGDSTFQTPVSSIKLGPGGSAVVKVAFTPAKGSGPSQAQLLLGDVAHAVLFGFAK